MATDWSDDISISHLSDEPALSEELGAVITRLENNEQTPHVVLDFAAVSYLNSSNLAQMLRIKHLLEERGRSMKVSGMAEEPWSIMTVTGLDKLFRFAPDIMTALAGLQIEEEQSQSAEPDEE